MEDTISDWRFKTLRHMETVRNHIGAVVEELLRRACDHDQTKLENPEAGTFEVYTAKLRGSTYGSDEYKQFLKEMQPALDHHYATYCHHPEHFPEGIREMNLIDLIEMVCDWKAASMRHKDGDIQKNIALNQKRFGYSDELATILASTVDWLEDQSVFHKAQES